MDGLEPFEKSCVASLSEKMDRLEAYLLWCALQQGDTALFEMTEVDFLGLLSLEKATVWSTKAYSDFMARVKTKGLAFPRFKHMDQYIAEEIARRMEKRQVSGSYALIHEKLNVQQKEALTSAIAAPIFFLTGGPGTGKTYTAGVYLKALVHQHDLSLGPLKVVLLAPTGKAVKTLETSIRRALSSEKESAFELHVMTLHAFLRRGVSKGATVALIDESSMIDTQLMYLFLQAAVAIPRLLFLGDADQLPSIEPGQPFADIVAVLEERKDRHIARLTLCERTDAVQLLKFAQAVCRGDAIDTFSFGEEVRFLQADSSHSWQACEAEWLKHVCAPWNSPSITLDEARVQASKAVILTPERQGAAGSEQLIKRAERKLSLKKGAYAPVLSTKNSYDLKVMNGEIGVLNRKDNGLDEVLFHERTVPLVLLERWQLAYAMTVHKSQGSEFQEVHLLLPPASILSRKLLYTAATRARRVLYLYGTKETLQKSVATIRNRMTFLREFLISVLIKST